jgi:hypothetical protein
MSLLEKWTKGADWMGGGDGTSGLIGVVSWWDGCPYVPVGYMDVMSLLYRWT